MTRKSCPRLWPAWMPAPITALRQGGQSGIRAPNDKESLHVNCWEKQEQQRHHGPRLSGVGRSPPALALVRTFTGGAFATEGPVSFCATALSNAAKGDIGRELPRRLVRHVTELCSAWTK